MKNDKNKLLEWLETFPETHESLRDLESIEVPDVTTDPEFQADLLLGNVTESILRAMEEEGLNRNQLANAMGKSRQYVGRSLNENANFTLKRLAEFAVALGRKVAIVFHQKNEYVKICRDEKQWAPIRSWQYHTELAAMTSSQILSGTKIDKKPGSYYPAETASADTKESKNAELKFAA